MRALYAETRLYIIDLLYFSYLDHGMCIWLCIWCASASKSETHRYTRIRTPHPVYLTSRALACRIRLENESLTIIFFAGLRPAPPESENTVFTVQHQSAGELRLALFCPTQIRGSTRQKLARPLAQHGRHRPTVARCFVGRIIRRIVGIWGAARRCFRGDRGATRLAPAYARSTYS